MKDAFPSTTELAVSLPLGVVAHQLMRIESDLRYLNMKVLTCALGHARGGRDSQVAARLEEINVTLDRIQALMKDIEADRQPKVTHPPQAQSPGSALRKPLPEWDD